MKVLIVGLGSIARRHMRSLLELVPDCEFVALRSSLNVNLEKGVRNIFNLNDEILNFDFAIVSNPTNLHHEAIRLLGDSGIPLFIEKPPLGSLDHADELIGLLEENQVLNYVACNLRFHPCILHLKNDILSRMPRINEVNVYCGSYLPDWRPGVDYRKSYSSIPSLGGGVHLDLFHEFDFTTWLFGPPQNISSVLRNVSSLGIDSFDYANYCLEYDCFTVSIILNYYRRKSKRLIEIVLDDRTLLVDLIKSQILDEDGQVIFWEQEFDVGQTYLAQLSYFISLLGKSQTSFNTFRDSIDVLKLIQNDEK
jgi:predicted dehydrogenase